MFSLDLFAGETQPVTTRCYFALRPTEDAAGIIEDLARWTRRRFGLDGRVYPADRLHLSLCPVGDGRVLKGDIEAAAAAGASVECGAFPAGFDTITRFGGPGNACVVLRCRHPSGALLALRRKLQAALIKAALPPGEPGFAPHITLVRPAVALEEFALSKPITWEVREFVLAQKGRGRARDVGRWALG